MESESSDSCPHPAITNAASAPAARILPRFIPCLSLPFCPNRRPAAGRGLILPDAVCHSHDSP